MRLLEFQLNNNLSCQTIFKGFKFWRAHRNARLILPLYTTGTPFLNKTTAGNLVILACFLATVKSSVVTNIIPCSSVSSSMFSSSCKILSHSLQSFGAKKKK